MPFLSCVDYTNAEPWEVYICAAEVDVHRGCFTLKWSALSHNTKECPVLLGHDLLLSHSWLDYTRHQQQPPHHSTPSNRNVGCMWLTTVKRVLFGVGGRESQRGTVMCSSYNACGKQGRHFWNSVVRAEETSLVGLFRRWLLTVTFVWHLFVPNRRTGMSKWSLTECTQK